MEPDRPAKGRCVLYVPDGLSASIDAETGEGRARVDPALGFSGLSRPSARDAARSARRRRPDCPPENPGRSHCVKRLPGKRAAGASRSTAAPGAPAAPRRRTMKAVQTVQGCKGCTVLSGRVQQCGPRPSRILHPDLPPALGHLCTGTLAPGPPRKPGTVHPAPCTQAPCSTLHPCTPAPCTLQMPCRKPTAPFD